MNILFMCVANSARSQLAEGIAKTLFGKNVHVESAGSKPSKVNPYAIRALNEIGIDITIHKSKSVSELSEEFLDNLDYVITLCAEEVCPIVLSKATKVHWPLPDPAGTLGDNDEQLERFRKTRDDLTKRLKAFGQELKLI